MVFHVLTGILLAAAMSLSPRAWAAAAPEHTAKKIIEYGWDCPDPAFVHAHLHEMEQRPFDGLVMRLPKAAPPGQRGGSLGWRVFGHERFVPADYEYLLPHLRAIRSDKLTDNFIQVIARPGDVDWDDDAGWDTIYHNIGVMAMLAKEGHCVGLMLDPEEYGKLPLWTFEGSSSAKHLTLEQAHKLAIRRGEQFIKAVNARLPTTQILCLFGPALSYDQSQGGQTGYALLAPFVEGMCRGADIGTRIADGFEQSYMYRTEASFQVGRKDILTARSLFEDKKAFDDHMQVAFGLWMDNDSGKHPWQTDEFELNYFQPDTWQRAIYYALHYSDHYIWVYSQAFNWWTGKNLPAAYEEAQRAGRKSPGKAPPMHYTAEQLKLVPKAAGRDDRKWLSDLLKTREMFVDLPESGWRFRPDPKDMGVKEHWTSPKLDDSGWSPIEVGKFWEEQGWDYDGYAWYRLSFNLESIPDKKILLAFGAADEVATGYLNGKRLGTHDIGELGWDKPFNFDVTGELHPGQNELAVRVFDRGGPGGLWKSVKLLEGK